MRRLMAGARKAFYRDKAKNQQPKSSQALSSQVQSNEAKGEINIDLSVPEPSSDGTTCWDQRQCGLCSHFLDRWFVLNMFTSKFVKLGTTLELLTWSQAGGRCPLCVNIFLHLIQETGGELPLDASVIVRWNTADTAVRGGRRDEVSGFVFELSWGYLQMKTRSVRMSCFTNEDQKMSYYMTTRPANPDVGSPAAFVKAQTWLTECLEGHSQCKRLHSGSLEMPSRVLEVTLRENNEYSVRLHDSTGLTEAYAALSYIWGKPQTCQTLKSNIDDHKKQINVKDIPQTIMDAVRCTQQLGLKYLWVDSLCIIQDSQQDKEKEIGRMSGIYKNAYVTISAAKTQHCDEGFLEPRVKLKSLMKSSFKLDTLTPKDPVALNGWIERHRVKDDFSNYTPGFVIEAIFLASAWNYPEAWYDEPSSIWLATKPVSDSWSDNLLTAPDIQDEPISKRGWTLQESWLSPRMLIYGSAQLIWKCNAGIRVDGGLIDSISDGHMKTLYPVDEDGDLIDEEGKMGDSRKQVMCETLWRDVVQESSRRKLTVPGDKLNALEGIVQEIKRHTGDEYLAGVWRRSLVSELSWFQDASYGNSKSILWNSERTCPSWSWIKTDGPIRFSHAENSRVTVEGAIITRNETSGEYPNSRLAVEGSITLRAPVSNLSAQQSLSTFKFPSSGSTKQAFSNVLYLDGALTNPDFVSEVVDGSTKLMAPEDLIFMELSWGTMWGSQNIAQESRGLVLVPVVGRPDTYRRVGFFVVALEYDVDEVNSGSNLVSMFSLQQGNILPTEFGEIWKASLEEKLINIV